MELRNEAKIGMKDGGSAENEKAAALPSGKMKALVFKRKGELCLEERPVPVIEEPTDAIVRVTRSTICTSDLHIRNGAVPRAVEGTILGHEFAGVVAAVGSAVKKLKPGDRAAANCETICGDCWYCRRGYVNNCEKGGWQLGCTIDGCQAEYVRVPLADTSLYRIPEGLTEEQALFTGDILSSGYWGAELCEIKPGDTVAVIGAGPVGMCAAESAVYLGAEQVILIDPNASRLRTAEKNRLAHVYLPDTGEEALRKVKQLTGGRGADAVIEAAGTSDSFTLAWELARPNAIVALVAMYEEDPVLPLTKMYGKNLIFKTGGVDACRCPQLLELLREGKLKTDFLITHRAPLSRILEGYETFEKKKDGCIKWVVTADQEA